MSLASNLRNEISCIRANGLNVTEICMSKDFRNDLRRELDYTFLGAFKTMAIENDNVFEDIPINVIDCLEGTRFFFVLGSRDSCWRPEEPVAPIPVPVKFCPYCGQKLPV